MTYSSIIAPPEPYEALIFDCDGTLVNTLPNHYRAWLDAVRAQGGDLEEEQFFQWTGMSTEATILALNEKYGYELDLARTHEDKDRRYYALLQSIREITEVVDVARANFGKVPMAVATGATTAVVEATLVIVKLRYLFSAVAAADEVVHGKPAPDIFLLAAERLGVSPAGCIVYEDGDLGLEGARRAGMRTVDVRVLWQGRPGPTELTVGPHA
jgi:beta-phosphoglucomutase-like phosphatase (HAD superfamily)